MKKKGSFWAFLGVLSCRKRSLIFTPASLVLILSSEVLSGEDLRYRLWGELLFEEVYSVFYRLYGWVHRLFDECLGESRHEWYIKLVVSFKSVLHRGYIYAYLGDCQSNSFHKVVRLKDRDRMFLVSCFNGLCWCVFTRQVGLDCKPYLITPRLEK